MSEVRGELKQNFGPNQRVTITRTTDSSLDGASATVIGLVSNPGCDFYIIQLDTPTSAGWSAILLIESCLNRLDNY